MDTHTIEIKKIGEWWSVIDEGGSCDTVATLAEAQRVARGRKREINSFYPEIIVRIKRAGGK